MNLDLEQAQQALHEAEQRYEEAKEREKEASRESTSCLNSLNAAQKEFDKEVQKIREESTGGDWKAKPGIPTD